MCFRAKKRTADCEPSKVSFSTTWLCLTPFYFFFSFKEEVTLESEGGSERKKDQKRKVALAPNPPVRGQHVAPLWIIS